MPSLHLIISFIFLCEDLPAVSTPKFHLCDHVMVPHLIFIRLFVMLKCDCLISVNYIFFLVFTEALNKRKTTCLFLHKFAINHTCKSVIKGGEREN